MVTMVTDKQPTNLYDVTFINYCSSMTISNTVPVVSKLSNKNKTIMSLLCNTVHPH